MKNIIYLIIILTNSIHLFSMPGDHGPKGEFDYTRDFWIGVRFNFYVDRTKVSTGYQSFDNPIHEDYNLRLKYLADSTMISLFGDIGFKKYFTMTCLQNPCTGNYQYANTFVTNNPCTTQPQSTCKEAIVTYTYTKKGVPLVIKMLVTIKDNGEYVQIEDNQFGREEIAVEKLSLLTMDEIQASINHEFPGDSISIASSNNPLAYYRTRIKQPAYDSFDKLHRDPGYKIIKETNKGKNWENGFIYIAKNTNPYKLPRVYTFDAVTGKLLWVTEIYNVPD